MLGGWIPIMIAGFVVSIQTGIDFLIVLSANEV